MPQPRGFFLASTPLIAELVESIEPPANAGVLVDGLWSDTGIWSDTDMWVDGVHVTSTGVWADSGAWNDNEEWKDAA